VLPLSRCALCARRRLFPKHPPAIAAPLPHDPPRTACHSSTPPAQLQPQCARWVAPERHQSHPAVWWACQGVRSRRHYCRRPPSHRDGCGQRHSSSISDRVRVATTTPAALWSMHHRQRKPAAESAAATLLQPQPQLTPTPTPTPHPHPHPAVPHIRSHAARTGHDVCRLSGAGHHHRIQQGGLDRGAGWGGPQG